MCAYSEVLPGYLSSPTEADTTRDQYLTTRTPKPLRPGSMNYPANFPKWSTSLLKAWYGNAATAENNFAYDYLPKCDGAYDTLAMFEQMFQGKLNGFITQGLNPVASAPNKKKMGTALAKLKYLVVIDPLKTETGEFWKNYGEFNQVDTAQVPTEVFRLPATCFAEDAGSFTNSSRVIQWHGKAVDPPGEAKTDREIIGSLFLKLREMYQKDGGTFPAPIIDLTWNYQNANHPAPEEVLREINGRALTDLYAAPNPAAPKDPPKLLLKAGEQLSSFGILRDDGSTACGNWIYAGVWPQAGNLSARRDSADPSGLGVYPNWGFSWPANRRILYNRASASPDGSPWDPTRTGISWNGSAWMGSDIPDITPTLGPDSGAGPFIMTSEGRARLFGIGLMNDGLPLSTTNLLKPRWGTILYIRINLK